ncbi:AAA family ATPase [Fomitiporia mediterranea MF3/22]|uniref:AAA family ATPase n=1 Tax=Fomitiporia mediterranea (strain MF3/22) TaxID=694068 RepID=UPI0004408360|nr:AAA family ATPase [Fomitiporia mediterranea MF3/22]EJD02417.1 AAA family ATPase [Fomitiporia mediterranea MF3/22]
MALSTRTFSAYPVDNYDASGSSSRASRRILINPDILKSAKVFAGDVVAISAVQHDNSTPLAFAVGIVWPSQDVPPDVIYVRSSVACISHSHMLSASLEEKTKIRVVSLTDKRSSAGLPSLKGMRDAHSVVVTESTDSRSSENKEDTKKPDWLAFYIREILVDLKYIYVGQRFQVLYEGHERAFTVLCMSANSNADEEDGLNSALGSMKIEASPPILWTANWDILVHIRQMDKGQPKKRGSTNGLDSPVMDGYASVGGLDKQISQIRDLIEIPLTRPDLFRHFGLKPPKGVLLHGPPGTGKTHLARAVVEASIASVIVVAGAELSSAYHGETERRLRDVFAEARRKSPCIVVLDEVDALAPRREGSEDASGGGEVEKRVVATLLTILDGIGNEKDGQDERVVVIGTTNRPNAIDPALRRPGRFDREIEIGIPDAEARHAILKVILSTTPHSIPEEELRSIASRTHGYVGADLSAVVREAGTLAIKRYMHSNESSLASTPIDKQSLLLTSEDLSEGLKLVQPSALRSITIEVPAVRWNEIGGQAHVAQKLRECVEWPLRHPEAFARLGVKAPRGVLLYGPPGCSKTLTARALATESGINFLAVKGPELLNKFVGESERAVREIFRKARAAAPSIVFFDEIDALGTSRSGDSGSGGKHEGVLTTLLNEMDGVQELIGVTIVAATNRPDVIDSALMRPGRLDRILYVGPPDRAGRLEILRIRTRMMSVDPDLNFEELADLTEGCSGAELTALCQDAALLTMQENIDAPFVPRSAFLQAAKTVRRQITPEIIEKFEQWRQSSGLTSA